MTSLDPQQQRHKFALAMGLGLGKDGFQLITSCLQRSSVLRQHSANFAELVAFAKEMTLLMQVLEAETPGCFDDLNDAVTETILASPASSIQLIKTWLLELFVRGTVPIKAAGIKQLEVLRRRWTSGSSI